MRCFVACAFVCLALIRLAPVCLAGQVIVDIGRGPVVVEVPSTYDPAHPLPLVLNLHGYTLSGQDQEDYFVLTPWAESEGFLYAYPEGLSDLFGNPFWNATDACCDLFGNGVDDSTYLVDLVDEIRDRFSVDPWRIHFVGWSNGGFMSFRMACDHADVVASLMSFAGATFLDPADCQPVAPVHVLQIHGTNDGTIGYGGGLTNIGTYPGAVQTAETWAGYNGCSTTADLSEPNRDIDTTLAGAETDAAAYVDGCTPGGSVRLWTVQGGPHGPALSTDFREGAVGFVLGHRKDGVRFTDKQTLAWPPVRWAQGYRVYSGLVDDLSDGDGDGVADSGYGFCTSTTDPDPTDTTLMVPAVPGPGEVDFYVIGFVEAGGAASQLGSTGNGAPRHPSIACP